MSRLRAYMLLEVVLALSIFIVVVVGLLQCLNAGLAADYKQQRTTNMRLNLQSLLDESLALPPREEKTEVPEDAYHVSYRREIKSVPVKLSNGKELKGIFRISITALDAKNNHKVIGELWTYASP